ncbi:alpha-ketoglutarate-dependent dioxygenase AlkB family protein [Roseibacillus ishigakijimensis]|uniref:Alpha-ketoglutarate-dependent dioxygenase AlkB n=1 Tax=Roseibacillus ishigakijimensis TaxID=454146 RepID=A0A934VLK9_9BACT|nr:alpha-ketoglutarate-dependent dioxygenase AlkB [Roseibacillus ishigakijimensis]MBK1833000.1 alpha-ketoglutarate-dependent dioxygenase AlkB [Roseibacillus ishigakijimensis]
MELDFPETDLPRSVLPYDGDTTYYGPIFTRRKAEDYLRVLLDEIPWQHDEAVIFGKHIVTARKVAWYGDARYDYTYSGRTRTARPWTPELLEIKTEVERLGGSTYNSCLLNLYADGTQGMGWHHDDEKGLGKNSDIASVSFGATRRFDFRHKASKEKVSLPLPPGSLLIMRGITQACWQHQLPKSKKIIEPRVNLTFRHMLLSETRIAGEDESGRIR